MADIVNRGEYAGDERAGVDNLYTGFGKINTEFAVDPGLKINAATEKTTPVDADMLRIADSATTFGQKKLSWANLKTTLQAYFDTLYNLYVHPTNHPASVVTQDASNRFVTDTEKSTWNGKEAGGAAASAISTHVADGTNSHLSAAQKTSATRSATAAQDGLATSTQITKLDGITTGAQVNSAITKSEIEAKLTGELTSHSHSKLVSISAPTASFTLALSDADKYIKAVSSSAIVITVPPNSGVAFPIGTVITINQDGTGAVSVTQGSGVTLNYSKGLKVAARAASLQIIKTATDTWDVIGGIA